MGAGPEVSSGGQTCAHAPVQVDVVPVSASNRYSARPVPSTSAVPGASVIVASPERGVDQTGLSRYVATAIASQARPATTARSPIRCVSWNVRSARRASAP